MESKFVQAGSVRLEYFEAGDGPETIVLVHGYASNAAIWRYTVQGLAEKGNLRTIAFNNRGAGESDRTESEADYSVETFADDLYNAVRALGLGTSPWWGIRWRRDRGPVLSGPPGHDQGFGAA